MEYDDELCRVWVGNISDRVTEEILSELFLQAGPVNDVSLRRDQFGRQKSFAFVNFKHQCSVSYAAQLFEGTTLFGRPIDVKPTKRSAMMQPEAQSVNSLRGFSGNFAMKGRDDLSSSLGGCSDVKPKRSASDDMNPLPSNIDFNLLQAMSQQMQLLTNPYASMMGSLMGAPPMYPSQMLDPVMNKQAKEPRRHNQNDFRSHDRYDRREKSHPYREERRREDNRRDDWRADDRRRGNRSYRHSSSSHNRERK